MLLAAVQIGVRGQAVWSPVKLHPAEVVLHLVQHGAVGEDQGRPGILNDGMQAVDRPSREGGRGGKQGPLLLDVLNL